MTTSTRTKTASTTTRLAAIDFAKEAAKIAADTRCTNVIVLDVRGHSPITDFFVIGTGTSTRQMQSVADDIEEYARPIGEKPLSRAYDDHWILLDFVDVVIHIFSDESRHFYDLESLWGEAKRVNWK